MFFGVVLISFKGILQHFTRNLSHPGPEKKLSTSSHLGTLRHCRGTRSHGIKGTSTVADWRIIPGIVSGEPVSDSAVWEDWGEP